MSKKLVDPSIRSMLIFLLKLRLISFPSMSLTEHSTEMVMNFVKDLMGTYKM
jgi:hypothetical protein